MTLGSKIKVGIVGYGNLGKGVEAALNNQVDMELVAVFTRRSINSIVKENPITRFENIKACKDYIGKIDVMVLCGGSMTDLPAQGPFFAKMFNTVDSFDTHAKIPDYFAEINAVAKKAEKVSIISAGWDPGLFSLNRMMAEAILPEGENYTFWGKGVSQGHSDALRRVQGVKDGVQYTIPMEKAMKKVRSGEEPKLTIREKHLRQCFVVAEKGADLKKIEQEIKKCQICQ
jgi:diaminopimelate dehydrogenase